MTDLKQAILGIIEENSGGLKMIELATELWKKGIPVEDPQILEATLKEMPELGILEYRGPVLNDAVRLKMFIYRRLDDACGKENP